MKKLFTLSFAALLGLSTFANPNEKVLKSFHQTFSQASDVRWVDYPDYYSVSFSYSGIRSRINYDKSGHILRSIRYYEPALLPLSIYTGLQNEYKQAKLFGVTEITEGSRVIYFVKMETAHHWITLQVDASGNSQVFEKYRKA